MYYILKYDKIYRYSIIYITKHDIVNACLLSGYGRPPLNTNSYKIFAKDLNQGNNSTQFGPTRFVKSFSLIQGVLLCKWTLIFIGEATILLLDSPLSFLIIHSFDYLSYTFMLSSLNSVSGCLISTHQLYHQSV